MVSFSSSLSQKKDLISVQLAHMMISWIAIATCSTELFETHAADGLQKRTRSSKDIFYVSQTMVWLVLHMAIL
jgi:hypothetical protein